MIELEVALAAAVMLAVAIAAAVGPRLKIPAPLILVVLGIGVSLLPFVPVITVPPELVLAGILPPLLYSASASLPATNLRREFGVISMLSVVLVVVSALVLGWVFTLLIPGLQYSWGVALGAVISPTDAVATSIVKQTNVSHRITAILEGESLLNDASALVLLRAAIAGSAAAVSVWSVAGQFLWAIVIAVVFGMVVGHLALWLRARVTDPTVNTVISFTVPLAVALPVEALGGSGLVAAVAAGLVVGHHGLQVLSPQHRRSDVENWATVSLLLEGSVFLLMGLEIAGIVDAAGGFAVALRALGFAVTGLVGVLALRAVFVIPLLGWLQLVSGRASQARERVETLRQQLVDGQPVEVHRGPLGQNRPIDRQRFGRRLQSLLADINYLTALPLGSREGAVVIWAGMRGAVTVAAAQTLPIGAAGPPQRPLLVLIAFSVAAISLLLQGGTLFLLIRWIKPLTDNPTALAEERGKVLQLVRDVADSVRTEPGESYKEHRLKQLGASRGALLDARDLGVYDSEILSGALAAIDAEQIALDLQGGREG